MIKLISFETSI